MDIIVLNKNFERIAVVDDYVSLIWCKRYYDIGALDLQIEANDETVSTFERGNYIIREDDDTIYRIEALEVDTDEQSGDTLIVGAYDCKKILSQRIIWNTITFRGSLAQFVQRVLNENVINPSNSARKISNFEIKELLNYDSTIEQQTNFEPIADKLIELFKSYEYGWKITFENGKFCFYMYEGVDRSMNQNDREKVIFSPEYENIYSSKYSLDSSKKKNSILVGGEGEGEGRITSEYGNFSGLDRFETFLDASSTYEDGEILTTQQYRSMLANLGKEELSKNSSISKFEGEVDISSYRYKIDYDLGDIVTIRDKYGISKNVRITEIVETWDSEGYTIEPVFSNISDDDDDMDNVLYVPVIYKYNISDGKKLVFTSPDTNVVFHYTIDGSDPTVDSPVATEVEFKTVGSWLVKVIAVKRGYILSDMSFINIEVRKVALPQFELYKYSGGRSITLTCSTPDVYFRGTTDGSNPTVDSSIISYYALEKLGSVTIKAKAWKDGYVPSDVATYVLALTKLQTPTITDVTPDTPPSGGGGLGATQVKIIRIDYPSEAEYMYYCYSTNQNEEPYKMADSHNFKVVEAKAIWDTLYAKARCEADGYISSDTASYSN